MLLVWILSSLIVAGTVRVAANTWRFDFSLVRALLGGIIGCAISLPIIVFLGSIMLELSYEKYRTIECYLESGEAARVSKLGNDLFQLLLAPIALLGAGCTVVGGLFGFGSVIGMAVYGSVGWGFYAFLSEYTTSWIKFIWSDVPSSGGGYKTSLEPGECRMCLLENPETESFCTWCGAPLYVTQIPKFGSLRGCSARIALFLAVLGFMIRMASYLPVVQRIDHLLSIRPFSFGVELYDWLRRFLSHWPLLGYQVNQMLLWGEKRLELVIFAAAVSIVLFWCVRRFVSSPQEMLLVMFAATLIVLIMARFSATPWVRSVDEWVSQNVLNKAATGAGLDLVSRLPLAGLSISEGIRQTPNYLGVLSIGVATVLVLIGLYFFPLSPLRFLPWFLDFVIPMALLGVTTVLWFQIGLVDKFKSAFSLAFSRKPPMYALQGLLWLVALLGLAQLNLRIIGRISWWCNAKIKQFYLRGAAWLTSERADNVLHLSRFLPSLLERLRRHIHTVEIDEYLKQGRFRSAEASSQAMRKHLGWHVGIATRARILLEERQLEAAGEQYQLLLNLGKTYEISASMAVAFEGLGDVASARHELDTALVHYREANRVYVETTNWEGVPRCLLKLGDTYLRLGQFDSSLACMDAAHNTSSAASTVSLVLHRPAIAPWSVQAKLKTDQILKTVDANLDLSYGDLYRQRHQTKRALKHYRAAVKAAIDTGDIETAVRGLASMGKTLEGEGQLAAAERHYEEAIGLVENIRYVIAFHPHRTRVFGKFVGVYEDMVRVSLKLLEEGGERGTLAAFDGLSNPLDRLIRRTRMSQPAVERRLSRAYEYIERAKGRSLVELLAGQRIKIRKGVPPSLLASFADLQRQLDQTKLKEDSRHARKIEKELLSTWALIRESAPEWASLRQIRPLTLSKIRSLLPHKTVLVELFPMEQQIVTFVIAKQDMHYCTYEYPRHRLWQRISEMRETMQREVGSGVKVRCLDMLLQELHGMLFEPIREFIEKQDATMLYFVPSGLLHLLPLHAIHEDIEGKRHYILDDYSIAYLPSASVLRFLKQKRVPRTASVFAIGNPECERPGRDLRYSEDEVRTIGEIFGLEKAKILIGPQATKEEVLKHARDYEIVHFACHASFRSDAPLLSGLNTYDGKLTMLDIFEGLELEASLVTLSACDTGIARIESGDEVIGLPRAFIYAGCPSVVATLWLVDDRSTSLLMKGFYRYLREGANKSDALRRAQIDLMNFEDEGKKIYASPYYWAPFVLIGDYM